MCNLGSREKTSSEKKKEMMEKEVLAPPLVGVHTSPVRPRDDDVHTVHT
jgi:hypothetical protein